MDDAGAVWSLSVEDVALRLGSDLSRGLSTAEAERRLAECGPNRLEESAKRGWLASFFVQLLDWMTLLLAVAAVISAIIGQWQDALLIAAIVVANAVIGYVQNRRAEQSLAALRKLSQPMARARRDGSSIELPALEIVPGDLVTVHVGDVCPADGRIVEGADLQVDESLLTGESSPVEKHPQPARTDTRLPNRTCMVYAGTAVTNGHAVILITATAMGTELGKIARLLGETKQVQTPLERRVSAMSGNLAMAVVGICVVVFAAGEIRAEPAWEMFLVAISLAVAAIPEGLPTVMAIALARSSQRMSARHAIVRQLAAVETLGSVNVICCDKTGTLTQNRMTVTDLIAAVDSEVSRKELLTALALCNNAELSAEGRPIGSATETALLNAVREHGMGVAELRHHFPRIGEMPFTSARKLMSSMHYSGAETLLYVKGAPEIILNRSTKVFDGAGESVLSTEERDRNLLRQAQLGHNGRRVLGIARRGVPRHTLHATEELETDLQFLGLVGLADPPRPEVLPAIGECRRAGIRVAMITGDHVTTAAAIARSLGLLEPPVDRVISGAELDGLDDRQLAAIAAQTAVYARVSPEHKLRIVRAHQAVGNVVAMTGDGVNDAPALKQADIGVAMGIAGSEVSRQAARMVLADDNFTSIVAAVNEGRLVYDNIRRFIMYLLTTNGCEIFVILATILFGLPVGLLPIHLLWINLISDGLPALALAYEQAESDAMSAPPRSRDESIFAGGMVPRILGYGFLMAIGCLWVYWRLLAPTEADENYTVRYARTALFMTLSQSQLFFVLALRSNRESFFRQSILANWRLAGATLGGTISQLLITYVGPLQQLFHTTALSWQDLTIIFATSTVGFWGYEFEKLCRCRRS